jgi:hypothetical protein
LALQSLGLFMVALDTLVVTTALPVLRVDVRASLTELEWTVNVCTLAFACPCSRAPRSVTASGGGGCSRSACRSSPPPRPRER